MDINYYDKNIKLECDYDMIAFWNEKKINKTIYHNFSTGKSDYILENIIRENVEYELVSKKHKQLITKIFIKASEDREVLCIIAANFYVRDIKDGDIRDWIEIERYYFTKDKKVIIPSNYIIGKKYDENHKIINYSGGKLSFDFLTYPTLNEKTCMKEIYKVFSPIYMSRGKFVCVMETLFGFSGMLLDEGQPKKQIYTKECEGEFKNASLLDFKCMLTKENFEEESHLKTYSYIEKIDNGICFRIGAAYFDERVVDRVSYLEFMRFYIGKDKYLMTYVDYDGDFLFTESMIKDEKLDYIQLFLGDKKLLDESPISFLSDILFEIPENLRIDALKLFLKHPVLEQFYKNGFKVIFLLMLRSNYGRFLYSLNYFIKINTEEKSFSKMVGLNNYQIKKINEIWSKHLNELMTCDMEYEKISESLKKRMFDNRFTQISDIKDILGKQNISDIDNESFDKLLAFRERKLNERQVAYEVLKLINKMYGFNVMIKMIDLLINLKESQTMFLLNNGPLPVVIFPFVLLRDYLDMVDKMDMSRIYKPYFKDERDIKNKHDEVVYIYNLKETKIKDEGFKRARERVLDFEYANDKYAVITPSCVNDLVEEGRTLKHCVKSYIDKVIDGKTNIMFLRKVSKIDIPFFTIEISDEGVIEQIHGMQNRNVDTEDKLYLFVTEWAYMRNLEWNNYNKVR